MLAAGLPLSWRLLIVFAAGVAGGVSNGIAGGGTFFTFPALLAVGIPPLQANLTSTVGIIPSFVGGLRGIRRRLGSHGPLVRSLVPWCVAGTAVGTGLLFLGSPTTFQLVVPWLIGGATVIFALAPRITALLAHVDHDHPARRRALYLSIFASSIYGGYFGAGLGIMLLAVMAITLPYEIHELQVLRNLLSIVITSVAAVIFIIHGHLAVDSVYALLGGTLVGGWLGTMLIQRLSPRAVRWLVVTIGVGTTVRLSIPG